jgi:hypothetical protein
VTRNALKAFACALMLALMTPQADASALIANCTMKSNADVKTMPSTGDEHLSWKVPKELAVEVYDQHGPQWAYITSSDDKEYPAVGWVLRSSLYKCVNTRPWKNR